jgi:undecaprenyl-diphosphatase
MAKNALDHDASARTVLTAVTRNLVSTPAFWLGVMATSITAAVVLFGTLPGEEGISRWFQSANWSWIAPAMEFGDLAGSKVGLVAIFGSLAIALVLFRRWKETSVLMLAATFYVFSPLLKQTIQRPRPNVEGIEVLVNPVGYSFPSGHAMGSGLIIGAAVLIAILVFRGRRSVKIVAVLAGLTMLTIIGSSRVYLGAHWISDVVAGYTLAAMLLLIALKIAQRTQRGERADSESAREEASA